MKNNFVFPDQHLPGGGNYWWHPVSCCIHLSVWSNDMAWKCNNWF